MYTQTLESSCFEVLISDHKHKERSVADLGDFILADVREVWNKSNEEKENIVTVCSSDKTHLCEECTVRERTLREVLKWEPCRIFSYLFV